MNIKSIDEMNAAVRTQENNTALKAIKMKCLDCSYYSQKEVKECTMTDCPLYAWRMGKNPFRTKKELTAEQKEALEERMKALREKRAALREQS